MVIDPQHGTMRVPIAPAPYVDRHQIRVGSLLSPQTAYAAVRMADNGYLWQLIDLLDELRETTTHLHSVLSKRELQVAGAEWELRPPEDSGDRGSEIAKWATRVLTGLEARDDLGRSFPDACADLLGAIYYGRSVLEVVWDKTCRVPVALEFVHPRRLAYATDWRLHLWDATGGGSTSIDPIPQPSTTDTERPQDFWTRFPGVPLDVFPAGKWVIHRPRVRGGYPTREGVGRTVLWWALFSKWDVRDWLAFAEWAGRGLRIGTYASGNDPKSPARASDEDVSVLQTALDAMSSVCSVVVPDTTKIDIANIPHDASVHADLLRAANAEISKAILGETLTTEVGETGGNRALGQVHDDVRLMIARADARALASTLRRDLLRPMVQRSFGVDAPVPEIAFAVDPKADLDALATRLERFVKIGGQLGQRTARNLLQIPDPEPGEELVTPPSKPPGGVL